MSGVNQVKITVNGKEADFTGATIMELLSHYKLKGDQIVVELNKEIVHREAYAKTAVSHGDMIEIVRFVGGG